MLSRSSRVLKKAIAPAQKQPNYAGRRPVTSRSRRRHFSTTGSLAQRYLTTAVGHKSHHPSSAEAKQKRESDREFLISILESSATKRDAKAYLQTFGSSRTGQAPQKTPAFTTILSGGIPGAKDVPLFVQGPVRVAQQSSDEVPHIAIVKLREPQTWDDSLFDGVAKTLTQLRDLGLRSVIVLECDTARSAVVDWKDVVNKQENRLIQAIGRYGSPGAGLVNTGIWKKKPASVRLSPVNSTDLFVGFANAFTTPLRHGHILVVPPLVVSEESLERTAADANDIISTLTRFFSGLQVDRQSLAQRPNNNQDAPPTKRALVDRVIVIDPYGGIPARDPGDGARVFINLEEQFGRIRGTLNTRAESETSGPIAGISGNPKPTHFENLELVKNTLAVLPPTSSAVITSPVEAANFRLSPSERNAGMNIEPLAGEVKTRRWQNPLIHNLLTDRPIYSASLPIGRIKSSAQGAVMTRSRMPTTTLAKRGLPVTIFPHTRTGAWQAPQPGGPRLRLTDTCIDLPRLVHLINDSFSRELDVEHYLNRIQDSLAGIIIAGEYEGGAILTWERPSGMDEETAYNSGRLVPYLDKFAVLKKSQGAGGVADIVFNAMVRDCFPRGVCWRSRKNNPVNKWYFERSRGVRKLPDSNWAMFWTTPEAAVNEQIMTDYEDVCRNVVPSWADTKAAD
ncbi:putative mitochondrial precursor of N-acetylglutamate synthase [Podospora australis]|uniref:Amino-acid acetyltransferase, mitochondrial n=1 Tax=Podospora australis TaxID=1536484 RepID=A0AAN7AQ94_9PEZI|nr:putative mitochondrial precursor of N-acetylglutamate synthase [Podospora australis]